MPDDNTEVQRPSDSGAEKNSVGAREESNAFQSERTEDLFKDRDTRSEKSESAQVPERTEEQGAREKSVTDTAAAVKSGDAAGFEKGVKSAFEDAKGDASKFKDFGDKLGEKLKDSGIKVDTKDSSITLDKDGKSVTYSMKDQLDMNSGKVSAEMKAESGNGQNPKDVIAGFADNKDKSAEKANDAHSPGNGQQGELTAPSNPEMKIRGIGKSAQVQRDVPVDASAAAEKKDPEQKDAPVAPEKKDPEQKDAPVAPEKKDPEQKDAPVAPEKKDPEQKDAPVAPEKKAPEQKDAPVAPEKKDPEQKDAPVAPDKKDPEQKDAPVAPDKKDPEQKDAPVAPEKKDPEQKDAPVAPEKKDPEQKDAPVAPEKKDPEQKEAEKPAADAAQEKAAKKPSEVLKDPHASAEDKLRAAKDMAKNGENKFTGDDGRQYRISTQKYGDREGVVVSTTDSKGKFMPVLRGLVDKEGKVTQQRDSSGKAVDYAGTKASREIKGDSVLTTGKKADGGSEKKVEPQPEEKKPQQPEEKKPQQPEEKKPQPEEKKPPEEKKVEPEQGDKGQGQKPEQKEKPPAEEKGQGNPKPETHDKPADGEKQPQDTKDKPEEKKKGPLGSDFVPVDKPQQKVETIASVYGRPQQTASGRYFRPDEMTAAFNPAHLPKGLNLKDGDVIRVTHDGKSVDVTLTDRGPYIQGRGIDLSTAAGRALGITVEGKGVGKVTFEKIGREPGFKDAPRPKKRK